MKRENFEFILERCREELNLELDEETKRQILEDMERAEKIYKHAKQLSELLRGLSSRPIRDAITIQTLYLILSAILTTDFSELNPKMKESVHSAFELIYGENTQTS
ncbi:MAG: hypothetical protein DRO95_06170 [Candidatus Altiarchaeales archaeon]|nr:MAG: hypothetical protein DRO95_06170 [Candidatus Altiarchaeales archaeon]